MPGSQAAAAAHRSLGSVVAFRHALATGDSTTVHLATYTRAVTTLRVVHLERPAPLAQWCARTDSADALVGGFFVTPDGPALGDVWVGGIQRASTPFLAPWGAGRACLAVERDRVDIAPRNHLPPAPTGDVLQAGPVLVLAGGPVVRDGEDPEGFSAGRQQFDSDVTAGRHPRAAFGLDDHRFLALACDGRARDEAGLTLGEMAHLMAELGARKAINLDGGGSAALVAGGQLRNRPRAIGGEPIPLGRPILTALLFSARTSAGQAGGATSS